MFDQVMRLASAYLFVGLRLDFIFLPNALPSACVRHYRAENPHRANTDLALVPSYAMREIEYPSCTTLNAALIFNDEDVLGHGLKYLEFDAEQEGDLDPQAEVPPWFDEEPNRYRLSKEFNPQFPSPVVDTLENLYKYSKIRPEWEKNFAAEVQKIKEEIYGRR